MSDRVPLTVLPGNNSPLLPTVEFGHERSRDAFICDTAELKWLFIENLGDEKRRALQNNISLQFGEVSASLYV